MSDHLRRAGDDIEARREADRVRRELDRKRPATGTPRTGWFGLVGALIVVAVAVAAVLLS